MQECDCSLEHFTQPLMLAGSIYPSSAILFAASALVSGIFLVKSSKIGHLRSVFT